MAYELPPLPYPKDALEPHYDAQTVEIHHDKHHQTYVTNLNNALAEQPALAAKSVADLLMDLNAVPEAVRELAAPLVAVARDQPELALARIVLGGLREEERAQLRLDQRDAALGHG